MEQKNIKKHFFAAFLIIPFASALLSKFLLCSASLTSSDIYYTGATSAFLRAIPLICRYGSILFGQLFMGASIAAVAYAVTYFGRITAVKALFSAIGAFLTSELAGFIYNFIRNSMTSGQIAATALAVLSELLFNAAILVSAFIGTSLFLKKRFTSRKRNRESLFSPYRAIIIPSGVSFIVKAFDLTFFNVIPFLTEYDDIQPKEILSILLDYAYYIGIYFILTYLLAVLTLYVFSIITGKLKPKFSGATK